MKKLLVAATLAVVLVSFAGFAYAGDYHFGATLICADCHIMHGSAQHDYNSGNAFPYNTANAPHKYLLRDEPNALCLQCHDGKSWAPDVMGASSSTAANRQAGALNAMAGNDSGYDTWKGHTLGSTDIAPGGTFTNAEGLSCVDCHAQHGQTSGGKDVNGVPTSGTGSNGLGAYRNVRTMGGVSVSYAVGTNDSTKDIFERSAAGYDVTNVDFNEPVTTKSGYAEWCKQCHTNFHGDIGSAEMGGDPTTNWELLRHPTSTVNIGGQSSHGHSSTGTWNAAGKTNFVKVLSASGNWGGTSTDATPSCMSCHKAHGNKNGFGLINMAGTGAVTEQGVDGAPVKSLCKQCHVQG